MTQHFLPRNRDSLCYEHPVIVYVSPTTHPQPWLQYIAVCAVDDQQMEYTSFDYYTSLCENVSCIIKIILVYFSILLRY